MRTNGTSQLQTSVWSVSCLHHLRHQAFGSVNFIDFFVYIHVQSYLLLLTVNPYFYPVTVNFMRISTHGCSTSIVLITYSKSRDIPFKNGESCLIVASRCLNYRIMKLPMRINPP